MKRRPGAVVDQGLVESLSKRPGTVSAAGIGPPEHFRRRPALSIHTDEAVPECTRRDVRDLAPNIRGAGENVIDRSYRLFECDIGVDLKPALAGRIERTVVFYKCFGDHLTTIVVERGAYAGRADVQTEDELLSQKFERRKEN